MRAMILNDGLLRVDAISDPEPGPGQVWSTPRTSLRSPSGSAPRAAVKGAKALIFECVGVPGVLGPLLEQAPWLVRVVVAGARLEPDTLFTVAAHTKGINVQFGGMPIAEDFSRALRALGDGAVDVEPWLTGRAGLDGAVSAFERAKNANAHARLIIQPNRRTGRSRPRPRRAFDSLT